MQDFVLKELGILIAQLIIGFSILAWLYHGNENTRSSKFFFGVFFIVFAGLFISIVDIFIRDVGIYTLSFITPNSKDKDLSKYLLFIYTFSKLVIPFSFAAVGAGLITNSIVSRDVNLKENQAENENPN